jgi:hypothetical protein
LTRSFDAFVIVMPPVIAITTSPEPMTGHRCHLTYLRRAGYRIRSSLLARLGIGAASMAGMMVADGAGSFTGR